MLENVNNPEDFLNQAETTAKHINFWQSEYVKRKFASDCAEDLSKIKSDLDYVKSHINDFLESYPSERVLFKNDEVHLLQQHYAYLYFRDTTTEIYSKNYRNVNVRDILEEIRNLDKVDACLSKFFKYSIHYGYFMDDLIATRDMTSILENILDGNEELPTAPSFHINHYFHQVLPERVLTLLRANPLSKNNKMSLNEELFQIYHKQQKTYYPYGIAAKLCGLARDPDVIIACQVLSKDFNFDVAMQEIRDHLVYSIFEHKKHYNLPLSNDDIKNMTELYNRTSYGEYGSGFMASRAIGLWLWDYMKLNGCSCNQAIRQLTGQENGKNLAAEHLNSGERTLRRLYETARKCIDASKVLPIKKRTNK